MLKFPATLRANRLEAGAAFSRSIRPNRLDFSVKNTRIAREHGGKDEIKTDVCTQRP